MGEPPTVVLSVLPPLPLKPALQSPLFVYGFRGGLPVAAVATTYAAAVAMLDTKVTTSVAELASTLTNSGTATL